MNRRLDSPTVGETQHGGIRAGLASFGLALLLNAAALGLAMMFPAISRPYYVFLAASALVTWYRGWRAGILSCILSAGLAGLSNFVSSQSAGAGTMELERYLGFVAMLALVFALLASLDRKKAELEEARLHFAGVVQISEDAIITVDQCWNITIFNAGAEAIFGYSAGDVLGKSINLLLPQEYRSAHAAHMDGFRNSQDVLRPMSRRSNIQGLRKDGTRFPAEASISKFVASGRQIVTVRLRDITERVAAELGLRELAAIVQSSHNAIVSTDMEGKIRSWNHGAEEMYGYTASEVLGQSDVFLLPSGSGEENSVDLLRVRGGENVDCETVRLRKDGTRIDIALTVSPIRDRHGSVVGASSIARDITERLRLEQLLNRSQKMEAVGFLAGGVAHDFNNLLAVIVGHAYQIRTSGSGNEQSRKAGEEILNAAEKAGGLTRQLLAFGRKQIMNPKVLDLNEVTGELVKMIPRVLGEDIEVHVVRDENLKPVKADPSQIEQILMNLVINARDAMPNGGKLTIQTANVHFDEAEGRYNNLSEGDYILLAVSDTGEGMSDETRSHIFEPFFTTKEMGKGTGLGLATVYGIVTQTNGHIWVYSELGNGTTFKIYFPATSDGVASPIQQSIPHRHDLSVCGTETLLLVEDQAPLRELFAQVLRDKGYEVISANGGLDALLQTSEQNINVDLLLTDIIMPQMRGDQVAAALAGRYPNMRVIYMSGHTDTALQHNGTLAENVVFLQKPFTPDAMLLCIRKVLDEKIRNEEQRRNAG